MLIREETNVDRGLTSDGAESCLVITRYWCRHPPPCPRQCASRLPSNASLILSNTRRTGLEILFCRGPSNLNFICFSEACYRFDRFNEEKGITRAKSALIQGSVYQCFLTAVWVSKPFKKCQKALISFWRLVATPWARYCFQTEIASQLKHVTGPKRHRFQQQDKAAQFLTDFSRRPTVNGMKKTTAKYENWNFDENKFTFEVR